MAHARRRIRKTDFSNAYGAANHLSASTGAMDPDTAKANLEKLGMGGFQFGPSATTQKTLAELDRDRRAQTVTGEAPAQHLQGEEPNMPGFYQHLLRDPATLKEGKSHRQNAMLRSFGSAHLQRLHQETAICF
jgi:hypothetical protein